MAMIATKLTQIFASLMAYYVCLTSCDFPLHLVQTPISVICSALCANPHMLELVVPLPLPKKERVCAEQVAKKLDLKTEFVSDSAFAVVVDEWRMIGTR